jgi:hypothetical protein
VKPLVQAFSILEDEATGLFIRARGKFLNLLLKVGACGGPVSHSPPVVVTRFFEDIFDVPGCPDDHLAHSTQLV